MSEYTFTVDGAGYRKRWSLNTFPEMVAVLVALGEIPEAAVDKLMELTRKWTPQEQVKLVEEMREQAADIGVKGMPTLTTGTNVGTFVLYGQKADPVPEDGRNVKFGIHEAVELLKDAGVIAQDIHWKACRPVMGLNARFTCVKSDVTCPECKKVLEGKP